MTIVTKKLQSLGADYCSVAHPSYETMERTARAINLDPARTAKTILLSTRRGYSIAVIPADQRLDMKLVHRATGDPHARLATEMEIERQLPAYEGGALPPLGSLLGVPAIVDPALLRGKRIVFPAGRQNLTVNMPTVEYLALEHVSVMPLTACGKEEEDVAALLDCAR